MKLVVAKDANELGARAAETARDVLLAAIAEKGTARVMLATGQSHFEFYEALLRMRIPWEKIDLFHLDEYVGLPATHKASFRKYLQTRLLSRIQPRSVRLIDGEGDVDAEIAALTAALLEAPIDLGIVGIGDNAHIAFNDPPANFDTQASYHVVELDERCRAQQVNEGWFATMNDVPRTAISATVHTILACRVIVSVVPHSTKAQAVYATLAAPEITNLIPATALRQHENWNLFLDQNSASLLEQRA